MMMKAVPASENKTLADGVESCLLDYIRNAKLTVGDPMPREEALAADLKISRHIVREGFSRLKALGLVESHRKRGTVLRKPDLFASFRTLSGIRCFSEQDYREFMELRIAIELGMCDAVFRRRTPEKIALLRKAANPQGNGIYNRDEELDFHMILISMAGNRTAEQFRSHLANALMGVDFSRQKNFLKTSTHTEICDALEHGTLEEFRELMRIHFSTYQEK